MINLVRTKKSSVSSSLQSLVAAAALLFVLNGVGVAAAPQQKTFASAEEAVKAIVAAARGNDDKEMLAIFGMQAKEILFSGDPVADSLPEQGVVHVGHDVVRGGHGVGDAVGRERLR